MNAITPIPASGQRRTTLPRDLPAQSASSPQRGPWRYLFHPLAAVCGVQAALSLTLVWSNTAFGDEAEYLWIGRLLLGHWRSGSPWPSDIADHLSGSPLLYPPLGALADTVGGLAGARILSLVFMLGATILLFLTAQRLFGRTPAVIATAIWALSEPVIRLAFATYDPLSVSLSALSAWLALQAGYRRGWKLLVAASGAALALANATAYSGIVIDPAVIAFAFLVWLPRMGTRRSVYAAASLSGGLAASFGLVVTVTSSFEGTTAVLNRQSHDHQSVLLLFNDIGKYAGLVIALAAIGVGAAVIAESRQRAALVAVLGGAILLVPLAQLHFQTAWSLDKHLAYGIWFAAMAAGYGCVRLVRWVPLGRKRLAVACSVLALSYPAVNSWKAAWAVYHAWPNARSFAPAIASAAGQSRGLIYTAGRAHVAEYYTPQVADWTRFSDSDLSLSPHVPQREWLSYYSSALRSGTYGVIALFYTTSFSSTGLPGSVLIAPDRTDAYQELLDVVSVNSGAPGLSALTQALGRSSTYRLVGVGPYSSAQVRGVYAIWQRVGAR